MNSLSQGLPSITYSGRSTAVGQNIDFAIQLIALPEVSKVSHSATYQRETNYPCHIA